MVLQLLLDTILFLNGTVKTIIRSPNTHFPVCMAHPILEDVTLVIVDMVAQDIQDTLEDLDIIGDDTNALC